MKLPGTPRAEARTILNELWLGTATKPAQHLYPHQWSWDSAFIAIGNRHHRWDRATLELRTLFEAQWPSGMVPHIVFSDTGGEYFPNAAFWDVFNSCTRPPPRPSSGICQPPVHATAAWLIYQSRPDGEGRAFLSEIYPKLAAWHDYLHRDRAVGSPLAEIWHPWESGMDNSPIWDQLLTDLRFEPADVPPYRRVDNVLIHSDDRPSDADYDRYAYLVGRLRAEAYEPTNPGGLPFRVRDVLFNGALARAEFDLANIADELRIDGSERRAKGNAVAEAIHSELWDPAAKIFYSQDSATGMLIEARHAGGLMGLLVPLDADRRAGLIETMESSFLVSLGEHAAVVLTVPEGDAGFDAIRYWRGPTWIQMVWLVALGLEGNGEIELAERMRNGVVRLVEIAGFFEYFNPRTLRGHGTDRFGWTSALYLDLLQGRSAG